VQWSSSRVSEDFKVHGSVLSQLTANNLEQVADILHAHVNSAAAAAILGVNKSSAVAEIGDCGHNRHGRKRGGGAAVPLSRGSWVPI